MEKGQYEKLKNKSSPSRRRTKIQRKKKKAVNGIFPGIANRSPKVEGIKNCEVKKRLCKQWYESFVYPTPLGMLTQEALWNSRKERHINTARNELPSVESKLKLTPERIEQFSRVAQQIRAERKSIQCSSSTFPSTYTPWESKHSFNHGVCRGYARLQAVRQ